VWFSTSGGVSRFRDGRVTAITTAHAPITGVVPVLVIDAYGYVWLGIQSGSVLMRFHASEMDKVADDARHRIAYTLYTETDGLEPGSQVWQSGTAGVRDHAGRIWVVDGSSMTIIDPQQLRPARRISSPILDTVTVNGERVDPAAVRRFASGSAVQIDYAALSLSGTSKLRFRHVLEGKDADWVYDPEDRRAAYTNLRAGDYRFRVSATEGGPWTEPSVWAFTINPPFYFSRWFLLTVGAVLVGGVAAAARLRVRAVKSRYALVIAERTRLSREIHDTLLQSLAALGPELETLATRVSTAPGEPTASSTPSGAASSAPSTAAGGAAGAQEGGLTAELRRLRRQVERSVRDARASILELRRHPMSTPRLAQSLAQFAGDTEARYGIRPTVTVVGRRPDNASPDVDLQLFRIAQEAVTNAVRHGHATRIDVHVAYENNTVTLKITDDGCGFDPRAAANEKNDPEHFGLVTMHERAEQAGGELRIDSAPGKGTTVYAVTRLTNEWV
jgi:signal transduction histidine kinase